MTRGYERLSWHRRDGSLTFAAAVAQLRHAYAQLHAGTVRDQQQFAVGLMGPAISALERVEPGELTATEASELNVRRQRMEELNAELASASLDLSNCADVGRRLEARLNTLTVELAKDGDARRSLELELLAVANRAQAMRVILEELLKHDLSGYGAWTLSMRRRVGDAIAGTEAP